MKNLPKQKNKGFSLVEVLVALFIFTLSVLALMSVLASGVADTNLAKKKIVAGYLAQEGIEHTRNLRDNNVLFDSAGAQHGWDAFKSTLPSSPSSSFFPITGSDFTGYTRTISANTASYGSDEIKIFSTVTWAQGSGTGSITFSENLFNWVE